MIEVLLGNKQLLSLSDRIVCSALLKSVSYFRPGKVKVNSEIKVRCSHPSEDSLNSYIVFCPRMPSSTDTGSAFSETQNNERILFTSESVGEGHPGRVEHNSDRQTARQADSLANRQLSGHVNPTASCLVPALSGVRSAGCLPLQSAVPSLHTATAAAFRPAASPPLLFLFWTELRTASPRGRYF